MIVAMCPGFVSLSVRVHTLSSMVGLHCVLGDIQATMLRPSTVHNSITRKPEVLNSLFNDVIVANDQGIVRRQVTVGMSAGKPVDSRPRLQILKPPSLGGLGHGLIPSSGQRAGSCFAMNQQHDRHRPSKPHFRAVADLREVKANSTIRH